MLHFLLSHQISTSTHRHFFWESPQWLSSEECVHSHFGGDTQRPPGAIDLQGSAAGSASSLLYATRPVSVEIASASSVVKETLRVAGSGSASETNEVTDSVPHKDSGIGRAVPVTVALAESARMTYGRSLRFHRSPGSHDSEEAAESGDAAETDIVIGSPPGPESCTIRASHFGGLLSLFRDSGVGIGTDGIKATNNRAPTNGLKGSFPVASPRPIEYSGTDGEIDAVAKTPHFGVSGALPSVIKLSWVFSHPSRIWFGSAHAVSNSLVRSLGAAHSASIWGSVGVADFTRWDPPKLSGILTQSAPHFRSGHIWATAPLPPNHSRVSSDILTKQSHSRWHSPDLSVTVSPFQFTPPSVSVTTSTASVLSDHFLGPPEGSSPAFSASAVFEGRLDSGGRSTRPRTALFAIVGALIVLLLLAALFIVLVWRRSKEKRTTEMAYDIETEFNGECVGIENDGDVEDDDLDLTLQNQMTHSGMESLFPDMEDGCDEFDVP
jgi:hypothetical protein